MSIEKYQDLVEHAIGSVAILQKHEIKVVNAQLLKMFGCRHGKEMVDHPFLEFVATEDRGLVSRTCLDNKNDEACPYHFEFKALRCDGKTFDAQL